MRFFALSCCDGTVCLPAEAASYSDLCSVVLDSFNHDDLVESEIYFFDLASGRYVHSADDYVAVIERTEKHDLQDVLPRVLEVRVGEQVPVAPVVPTTRVVETSPTRSVLVSSSPLPNQQLDAPKVLKAGLMNTHRHQHTATKNYSPKADRQPADRHPQLVQAVPFTQSPVKRPVSPTKAQSNFFLRKSAPPMRKAAAPAQNDSKESHELDTSPAKTTTSPIAQRSEAKQPEVVSVPCEAAPPGNTTYFEMSELRGITSVVALRLQGIYRLALTDGAKAAKMRLYDISTRGEAIPIDLDEDLVNAKQRWELCRATGAVVQCSTEPVSPAAGSVSPSQPGVPLKSALKSSAQASRNQYVGQPERSSAERAEAGRLLVNGEEGRVTSIPFNPRFPLTHYLLVRQVTKALNLSRDPTHVTWRPSSGEGSFRVEDDGDVARVASEMLRGTLGALQVSL